MGLIMDYILIKDVSRYAFLSKIRDCIELGYKPIGGISIASHTDENINNLYYAQAMIKDNE